MPEAPTLESEGEEDRDEVCPGRAVRGPIWVEAGNYVVDTRGYSSVWSNDIAGPGGLVKAWAGTLTLSGSNSFTGTTTVRGGVLANDGALAGAVVVETGGTLAGTGRIGGTASIAGTLRPAHSPGTLVFAAPVVQTAGSTLTLDIDGTGTGNGAGNYARVLVQGAGNGYTAAGTIRPVLRGIAGAAGNAYTPPLGQGFTVVQADGGVGGSFDRLAQPEDGLPPGTRFDTVYGSTTLTLHVTPAAYGDLAAAGLAPTANQSAVGAALDTFRPVAGVRTGGETGTLFDALAPLDAGGVGPALDQLGGVLHADMLAASLANRRLFGRAVESRLAQQRDAAGGGIGAEAARALPGFQLAYDGGTAARSLTADESDPAGPAQTGPDTAGGGWTLWARGLGGFGRTRGDGNAAGYDQNTGGGMIGGDVRPVPELLAGFAFGYAHGAVSAQEGGGQGGIDSDQLLAYGGYTAGPLFLDAGLGYAFDHYETHRSIAIGTLARTAQGEADGHALSVALAAGWRGQIDGYTVEPAARLRYDQIWRNSFSESGAGLRVTW